MWLSLTGTQEVGTRHVAQAVDMAEERANGDSERSRHTKSTGYSSWKELLLSLVHHVLAVSEIREPSS